MGTSFECTNSPWFPEPVAKISACFRIPSVVFPSTYMSYFEGYMYLDGVPGERVNIFLLALLFVQRFFSQL